MVMHLPPMTSSLLQSPGVEQDVSLEGLGLALLALVLSSLGAHASSALQVYSPTKLAKKLAPERAEQTLQELRRFDMEYRVAARLLMIGGAVAMLFLLKDSVHGSMGNIITLALALSALFLVGVLPAAIVQRRAEALVLFSLGVLRCLRLILQYPVIKPLLWLSRPVLRALKIPDHPANDPEELSDNILAAVADSDKYNALPEEERLWISNIVELKDLHVSEAMTPRTDIVAFEDGTSLDEAVKQAISSGHSRYPVYDDDVDKVVGIFYAKDALARLAGGKDTSADTVKDIMRKPLYAPESMPLNQLLREFKTSKVQMAVVLDEYGGTAGLISIEDILEEIVGDINDEFDPDEEQPIQVIEDARIVEVSGKTRVDELDEVLPSKIPEGEEYDTVAGFVFSHLGQIPAVGTTFQANGVEYKILSANDRRIGRLRLTLLEPQPSDH